MDVILKCTSVKTRGMHVLNRGSYANRKAVKMLSGHSSVLKIYTWKLSDLDLGELNHGIRIMHEWMNSSDVTYDRYLNSRFGAERAPLSY